jgi:hypothetical protein
MKADYGESFLYYSEEWEVLRLTIQTLVDPVCCPLEAYNSL